VPIPTDRRVINISIGVAVTDFLLSYSAVAYIVVAARLVPTVVRLFT